MKHLSCGSGFSLVELLVVITIVFILASVILPVMSVGPQSNQSTCMSNLKQIALAVLMYNQDDHGYPKILGSEVRNTSGELYSDSGGTPEGFEHTPDQYLCFEYVKCIAQLHCRSSSINNTTDVVDYWSDVSGSSGIVSLYAYDSYDVGITNLDAGQSKGGGAFTTGDSDRDALHHSLGRDRGESRQLPAVSSGQHGRHPRASVAGLREAALLEEPAFQHGGDMVLVAFRHSPGCLP